MREVQVELGDRAYPIVIGEDAVTASAGRLREVIGRGTAAIVADETVWGLHEGSLRAVLPDAAVVTVPSGEGSKSWAEFERVSEALLAAGVGRDGTVIAFGGGVVGDLAGFCAASLRRGCKLVQIPTTLLAMVDSSVGGKTAINTKAGKNLVGAFYQPSLVIADTTLLETLPERELLAGYSEVAKYGLLGDAAFADWLKDGGAAAICARDEAALARAIERSCEMKAAIVAEDETEKGRRALLNLGHTFGHAVEAIYGFDGRVLHGEGVAVGCCLAFRYAERELGLGSGEVREAETLFGPLGLPAHFADLPAEPSLTADAMLASMYQDKKVEAGELTLVLPRKLGDAYVAKGVPGERVRAFLEDELR